MNDLALALDDVNPLLAVLERHFEKRALDARLGLAPGAVPWRLWETSLWAPLRDLLAQPGKGMRARLVQLGWELGGGAGDAPESLAWMIELLHAGSLVVDDIEDGSAYRRGRPALHVAHGLPLALNAGNLLYFLPLALLEESGLPESRQLAVHRRYADAVVRCHHGQALDLCGRLGDLAQHEVHAAVEAATRLKTGSLVGLALALGAVAAGASPARERAIVAFGDEVGIALQMLDDLGGITSQRRRAKGHEDLLGGRLTWTWAWIADEADGATWGALRALGDEVEGRATHPERLAERMRPLLAPHARVRVRRRLRAAIEHLRAEAFPASPVRALESELDLLERSYE